MNIELKALTHGPIYAQVRAQIEELIASQAIPIGETLPAPAVLAQQLAVDKGEIQRAYFELEQGGLINKESGTDFLGKPRVTYRVKKRG